MIRFHPRLIWSASSEWSNSAYLHLFSATRPISRHIPCDSPEAGIIGGLLEEMFQECHSHAPAYELIVQAKLVTVLANMARYFHQELKNGEDSAVSQRRLTQMDISMDYIHSHLGDPLTLDLLAREACMSRSYYSTIFKTLNGVSVWDSIIARRIDLAQYKLETTADSIMSIGEGCGFTGIANFNRTFKKLTGKTPREYRKMMRAPAASGSGSADRSGEG